MLEMAPRTSSTLRSDSAVLLAFSPFGLGLSSFTSAKRTLAMPASTSFFQPRRKWLAEQDNAAKINPDNLKNFKIV